jgi:Uma2 family endonuclease
MAVQIGRHHFTVHDYARMRESGILSEDDRVELLDGEVYTMSPIGPLHVAIVNRLTKLLVRLSGDEAVVSVQNPIRLHDYSEPEPDFAVLRVRDDDTTLATVVDVLLLIEVADSSLVYDREQKLPRYAEAGIGEVWIIDVEQQLIEQYTQPLQAKYTQVNIIMYGRSITSAMFPAITLTTDRIL